MKNIKLLLTVAFFSTIFVRQADASHVIGATINYKYLSGDSYEVTILCYRDCRSGTASMPDSIALTMRRSDNASFIHIFKRTSKRKLPLPLPDPCAEPPAVAVCVEEYEYKKVITGIQAGFDHHLFFSTRLRNNTITNIEYPGSQSETVYTKIPDRNTTPNQSNAQFVTPPPSYVCGGQGFTVKDSSFDADGDRVSYELYNIKGGDTPKIPGNDPELHNYLPNLYIPQLKNGYPDFVDIKYSTVTANGQNIKFSAKSPMNAQEKLDSVNGQLSFNASVYGQFVVGIKLKEYRGNKLISETFRDFQFNIVRCPPRTKSVLALMDYCQPVTISPKNEGISYASTTYLWKFGDPSKSPKDTSNKPNPTYTYATAGNYNVMLITNPRSPCADTARQSIRVTDMKAGFSATRDTCVKLPVDFTNVSKPSTNSAITSYFWDFGDGQTLTTASATNPTHTYATGGSYIIKLKTTNTIGCKDSASSPIKIIQDYPDAIAGSNDTLCKNNPTVQLNGSVKNAGGGVWTGGKGLFNPDSITLNAKYTPTQSELTAGAVKLLLTTTKNGKCGLDTGSVTIRFANPPLLSTAIVPYSPVCENNPQLDLRGSITSNPPMPGLGIIWTVDGTFKNGTSATDPFASYVPSQAEILAQKINLKISSTGAGKCNPVSATSTVDVKPVPTVNAGNDTTVCANNADVFLKGKVTIATKVKWSTSIGADGSFVGGVNALTATYRPGSNDKSVGKVFLYLTTNETSASTYPQNCKPISDTVLITITPAPVVNAGADQSLCANNPVATLNGKVTPHVGAGKGIWSGGKGSFFPNATTLNATYTPSDSEVTAKSVKLVLTSTDNGKCLAESKEVALSYTAPPTVDAGKPLSVCRNNPAITLGGLVSNGTNSGVWSGGAGGFSPDASTLNAVYQPSATELSNGSVRLILTSTNNGQCASEKDTVVYAFTDSPKIDAGNPIIACKNNTKFKLNATLIQVAKGVKWSGGKGTFSPNDTVLAPEYTPDPTEVSAGKLILTATSTGMGTCAAISDTVGVTFIDPPTVNPGSLAAVCANKSDMKLNGSTSTGAGTWSSTTGGQFLPNAQTLGATYKPSKTDSTNGLVLLLLTSGNNGLCTAVSQSLTVTITKAPVVNAGPQQNICSNNANIKLNGSVTGGAATGIWSGGSNNFSGGKTKLNATYIPSATDIANKKVTLTLTSTGNTANTCAAVSDTVTFYFTPAPTVNPGGDQTVCGDLQAIKLNGTSSTTKGKWRTSGTGKFADSTKLVTTYTPTQLDADKNSIVLTLISTSNGNCSAVQKSINIVFTSKPSVNAGPSQTFCTGDSAVQLAATGSAGKWSTTTGGTFQPSPDVPNAQYIPSVNDLSQPNFKLTYTSNVAGSCPAVSSTVTISVKQGPTVNPGSNATICADQVANLSGTVQNAEGVQWITSGSGTFTPSDTILTPSYKPSPGDVAAKKVTLTLKALSSQCKSNSKSLVLTINPKYEVNAGGNQTLCSDVKQINLSGTRSATFPVKWITTGGGQFTPNDTALTAKYVPVSSDLTFNITLTSQGAGCPNQSSTLGITLTPAPQIDAGNDIAICNDTPKVDLKGKLLNAVATGGFWTTKAGGIINPNALNATYAPKIGEKGSFTFYLTSTGNGTCKAVTDSILVTIVDKPTVNVGPNGKICADADTIYLTSSSTNATGGTWSVLTGTGKLDNVTASNTFYVLSKADSTNGLVNFKYKADKGVGSCKPVDKQVSYEISPATTVNAGGDVTYCTTTKQIPLTATVTVADSIRWSTLGTGTFVNNKSKSTSYLPSPADTAAKRVKIVLTALATNICKPKSDTLIITFLPSPKVSVPADFTVCADTSFIALKGTSSTGAGIWSSDAGNTFSPSTSSLGTKYVLGASDPTRSKITFTLTTANNDACSPVSKSVIVTINASPTIVAGANQDICSDGRSILLSPTLTGAATIKWTSSGSGKFASTNSSVGNVLNDTYLVSNLDTAAKTVVLLATATSTSGLCKVKTSPLTVKITAQPSVDAGPSADVICGDVKGYALTGKVKNAKSYKWTTSGTGRFAPNDSTLNATYLRSKADSLSGKVNLMLTAKGLGKCLTYSDTLKLTITPAPVASVSDDRAICGDKDTVKVSGKVAVATGMVWSTTGKGKFSPSVTSSAPSYQIVDADRQAGKVVLKMQSTGNGTCKAASDSLVITINQIPTVNAGVDNEYCASVAQFDLDGSLKIATKAVWKTSGSGTFSDSTDLAATYFPSAADKASKSITLTLSTKEVALCNVVSDKVIFSFSPIPEVDPGKNQTLCKEAGKVQLSGTFKNSQMAQWFPVNGTGDFLSEPTDQSVTYKFSSADTSKTSLTFSYTSVNAGKCAPATKTLTVSFFPSPVITLSTPAKACEDATQIKVNGTITNAAGYSWATSGTNPITATGNGLEAIYTPTNADIAKGSIDFTLTSKSSNGCKAYSKTATVVLEKKPVIASVPNHTFCGDTSGVLLVPSMSNVGTVQWASSSGQGSFSPSATVTSPSFKPSAAQIESGTVSVTVTAKGTGTCVNSTTKATSILTISQTPKLSVPDVAICQGGDTVSLNASNDNGIATSYLWSTLSPNPGSFTKNASLSTQYVTSGQERALVNTSVQLLFQTTAQGKCKPFRDTVNVTFTATATVSAGLDQVMCTNKDSVRLSAAGSSEGVWTRILTSGLGGTFKPSRASLSPSYFISEDDSIAGAVFLEFKSKQDGTCTEKRDTVRVEIVPGPSFNPLPVISSCANVKSVSVDAKNSAGSVVSWLANGSGVLTNANNTVATYDFSDADIEAGGASLQVKLLDNAGICKEEVKTVQLLITPAPVVDAGSDLGICGNATSFAIQGTVTKASIGAGRWSILSASPGHFGTTNSASSTALSDSYFLTSGDTAFKSVQLVLTSDNNGACKAVSDTVKISFTPIPRVTVPNTLSVCGDTASAPLNGLVSIVNAGTWSHNGKGILEDSTLLSTSYIPSTEERDNGAVVTLTLKSLEQGSCLSEKANLNLTIGARPVLDKGIDNIVCGDTTSIVLDGSVKNVSGGIWTIEKGDGRFAGNAVTSTNLTDTYTITQADVQNGSATLKLTTTGVSGQCKPLTAYKLITITEVPRIEVGPDVQVCANNSTVSLQGQLQAVATGGTWASLGTGVFAPKGDSVLASYTPSAADSANGSVVVYMTSKGNGICKAVRDSLTITITPQPTVQLPADMDLCADMSEVALVATVSPGFNANWTSTGLASFANPSQASTTYFIKEQSGNIVLTLATEAGYCNPVAQSMTLKIAPRPVVNAGADTTICAETVSFGLRGSHNAVVTATQWATGNGATNFVDPISNLSVRYKPSQEEREAGQIIFALTSTAQGKCQPVSDVKLVTIQKFPALSVNAGFPQTICYSTDLVMLQSKLENIQKAQWTSLTTPETSSGEFIDPAVRITGAITFGKNEYVPSLVEKGNAKDTAIIHLRLTGINSIGQCMKTVTSDVDLIVVPQPQVTLTNKDTFDVCADKDTINVGAEARVGGTLVAGFWTSTGTGVFEPNKFSRNASYRLSAADRKTAAILLTYNGFGGGGCDTTHVSKVVNFAPPLPEVMAGDDQIICKNNLVVPLNGQVSVSTLYNWSVTPAGGSFVPGANSLQTTFIPTQAMVANGAIKLQLRSKGPLSCKDVTDNLLVTFSDKPMVTINADSIDLCADTDTLSLSAEVTNATGGIWSSTGNGRFIPSNTTLNAKYLPSTTDKAKGKVLLILTSTGVGKCLPEADSVQLSIRPRPVVTDTAVKVCINADSIQIKATSTTGAGFWSSSSSGTFAPSVASLNAFYFPSQEDYKAGQWNLAFTSSDNQTCKPVSKTITLQMAPLPLANAGPDQRICLNTSTILSAQTAGNIVKYTWTKLSPVAAAPVDSIVFPTGVLATTSTYQLRVTDALGCTTTDTVAVKPVPRPKVDIPVEIYCAYRDSTLQANVIGANPLFGTFQWFTNHSFLGNQDKYTTKIQEAGIYSVVFAIGNCETSDSVDVKSLPILEAVNHFVCENSDVTIKVSTPSVATEYLWRKGSPNASPFATTRQPFTTQTNLSDTTIYYVTIQDDNACQNIDSLTVFTVPKPTFTMKDSSLCAGLPLQLKATPRNITGAANRFSYKWSPTGDTTESINAQRGADLAKIDSMSYTVVVKVGNETGSCDGTAKAKIVYYPLPKVDLPSSRVYCGEDKEASILDAGVATTYKWSTGEDTRTIRVRGEGQYKVTVSNAFKCSASDSVTMIEKCKPTIFIPTAFSPNGDNNNDYLVFFGNKFVRNFRLIIFNRWGEIIYNVEDADGTNIFNTSDAGYTWDGSFKGKPMPVGTYPFVVTYEGKDEEYKGPFKKEGSVMVIR